MIAYTYCMTSHCPLALACARFETDAARHALHRTYADFSEELIRHANGKVECPFLIAQPSEHPQAATGRLPPSYPCETHSHLSGDRGERQHP